MAGMEQQRLSAFSNFVRQSTLKRFKAVPPEAVNWSIVPGAMSFADLAQHIIICDHAMMRIFESKQIGKNLGEAGMSKVEDMAGFESLIDELKDLKKKRRDFLLELGDGDLDVLIDAERLRGVERLPAGSLILEMLDHEIHHRGQLASYLRVYEASQGAKT